MGLLDFLLGSPKKPHIETAQKRQRSGSDPMVSYIGDSLIIVKSIRFSGLFRRSQSGEWIICWSDADEEQHRGGHRESGYGRYVLYNAVKNTVAVQGRLERPNSGHVANNGCFSIEDWHFGSNLSGTFHVFSSIGNETIRKKLNSNILNSGISDRGKFAICQTANNPNSADGNMLFGFDVEKSGELFSVHPKTEWANRYEFIEDTAHFVVVIKDIGKFRYDAQGHFIDIGNYDSAKLNCNRFEVVLFAAEELLKDPQLDQKRAQAALAAALRARSLGADNDRNWKAVALKIQGLANEALGNNNEALSAFVEALKINQKIGVKRKADALRKKQESRES